MSKVRPRRGGAATRTTVVGYTRIALSRWLVFAAVALASGTWTLPACAQAARLLDRFTVGVGTYHAVSSTTLGAGLPDGIFSTSVNLEDSLGFDDSSTLPRIRASMLVDGNQGLSLDYYRYSHASSRAWHRMLAWQGTDYDVRARLHGRVSFAFGSLAWRWWFGTGDDVFGLGLGASHYRASGSLSGTAVVNNDPPRDVDTDTGASTWAPLVQLGWRHAFGGHWRAYFDAAGVFKGGGKLQGHIYNASLGLEWLPAQRIGVALEYGVNSIHVTRAHAHYEDSLDLQLYGPSAFVYLRF